MAGFWADIRKAMARTIAEASGFPIENVIWASQNENQPQGDYIDLSLSGHINPGQDGVVHAYEASAQNGQQIVQSVIGQREVTLTVEIFTKVLTSNNTRGAVLGEGEDALAVADRIRTSLVFEEVRDIGAPFGISWFDLSATVEYIPKIVSTGFRGRAVWPVRCLIPSYPVSRRTQWIETVDGRVVAHGSAIDPEVRDFSATD